MLLCAGSWLGGTSRAAGPAPLTLDALLAQVGHRSPELASRRAQVRAARERPAQARALEDPMLMVELWQVPTSLAQVPMMFTLRQPIPWPGKLSARAAVAEPEGARAQAEASAALRSLRLLAVRAYYEYRLAVRSLAVQQEGRQLLDTLVGAVDIRYRVGRAELAELLGARQALGSLDASVLDIERQRDLAITALNTLLDLPADEPLGMPVTAPDLQPLPDLRSLTEQALSRRPELQGARAGVAAAQGRMRMAHAEQAPDVAAWAGYMTQLRGGGDNTFTIGLQASLPSFSLQRTRAAAREALAETAAQQAALQQLQARIRGEVREAFLRLQTAHRHLQLHHETLIPLAEQSIQAAQASYQSGRINLVVLLEAARMLIEHRLEYERFSAEYGQQLGELEAAISGPAISTILKTGETP